MNEDNKHHSIIQNLFGSFKTNNFDQEFSNLKRRATISFTAKR